MRCNQNLRIAPVPHAHRTSDVEQTWLCQFQNRLLLTIRACYLMLSRKSVMPSGTCPGYPHLRCTL
eukprot:743379-Pelagomonas_calceolata.AAC.1